MKLIALLMMVLAALALFVGNTKAAPKVNVNAIKKRGHAIKKGLGVLSVAGTAHEIYSQVRNRKNH